MAAVATSTGAFAQTAPISTTMPSTVRIYGFSASATTGTMRVQNMLTVTGSVQ